MNKATTTSKTVTIERTFPADLEKVWELWTTKEGIESWWGPEGFRVEVGKLELRPGGELEYTMIATGPDQIEFLKNAGMPLEQHARIVYLEVAPPRRLRYTNVVDFVPEVEPYEVGTLVELEGVPGGVRLVLTLDVMHDEEWTKMAVMGWESELGKLARRLVVG